MANLNGDEFQDVVIGADSSRVIQVLLGNGDGSFDNSSIPLVSITDDILEIVAGRFDGDENDDILVITDSDSLYLLSGTGTGPLEAPQLVYSQSNPIASVSCGDLNGDGQDDIALSSACGISSCPPTRILLSDGLGGLNLDSALYSPSDALMIDDIDGDADLDLVLSAVELEFYLNDGLGNFTLSQSLPLNYAVEEMIQADVFLDNPDGIGNSDLICLTDSGDSLAFLEGEGDGTFGDPIERYFDQVDSAQEITAAQLDGMGAADLLFYSDATDEFTILFGHGEDGLPYQGSLSYPTPNNIACMKVVDLDEDGVLDVIVASRTEDVMAVYLGIEAQEPFKRGDANSDNFFNIADPVTILEALFLPNGGVGGCPDSFDANDDGLVDISDGVISLMFLFGLGEPLAAPFPECGNDPTFDLLNCQYSLSSPCP
ncbi:MAG: VCBS repeat-containing protein [Planctomycetota bacterium]|nr:VCBS repeat-containing protein [Planctomycetota bacterium]